MNIGTIIVSIAIFASVTSLLMLILNYRSRDDSQIHDRLAGLTSGGTSQVSTKFRIVRKRHSTDGQSRSSTKDPAHLLLPDNSQERLQTRLVNAGIYYPHAVSIYVTVKLCLASVPPITGIIAGSLGWISPDAGLLIGSLIGIIGLFIPSLWLRRQKRKWHSTIARSLADFLDLMVACLEVGLSAEGAIQRVTEELRIAHPRLCMELSVVQSQIELGASSDTALKNFADRSDNEALRSLASVVQQGRRLGGGMADVFRQQAESLRVRREYYVEEKAQQAAVKILIPTLLFIFPVIFVVLAGPAVIKICNMFGNESGTIRIAK